MKYIVTRKLQQFIEVTARTEQEAIKEAKYTMDSLWQTEEAEYGVTTKEKYESIYK